MLYRFVDATKKQLLLLLGALVLLAGALPSEAMFHVCYFDPEGPATVYIDEKAVFRVANDPFSFVVHTARLRPGVHTLAVRKRGGEVVTTWFLYLHFNSTVVEYTLHENDNDHTWGATPYVGQFVPD